METTVRLFRSPWKTLAAVALIASVVGCSAGKKGSTEEAAPAPAPAPTPSQPTAPTTPPAAPVIIIPSTLNPSTNTNVVTVSGTCTDGANLDITGEITHSFVCSGSSFSYDLNKNVDGSYIYNFAQSNSAGSSASVQLIWTRDATAPAAPVITTPAMNPYYTNSTNINLSGTCETGALVSLSSGGSAVGSVTCANSAFSFNLSQSVDGTYNYVLHQSDAVGNISADVSFQWVLSTTAPNPPVITAPSASPYYSNTNSITISGTCVTGYTVNLGGAGLSSTSCANSSFSFNVAKAADGSYAYTVTQTNQVNLTSSAANMVWIRDTVAASAPFINSPLTSPKYSNVTFLALSGACEANSTVYMTGAENQTATCTGGGSFSFALNTTSEGQKDYQFYQRDAAGNNSGNTSFTWIVDLTAPAAPVITTPATTPITTGDNSFTVAGSCETGSTVSISGALNASMTCSASAFSFIDNQMSNATFDYSVTQSDAAGNISPADSVQWNRDDTIPATPVISTPATTPFYSSVNSITISGSCTSGFLVSLGGDVVDVEVTDPANSLTMTCTVTNTFSFTVAKSLEGTYSFTVLQESLAGIQSANATLTWHLDTTAPSAPVITTPTSASYTSPGNSLAISGTCEDLATVNMSNADTQSVACTSGSFTFNVVNTVDGSYQYDLSQTDLAGNISAVTSQTWIRSGGSTPPPVITSPVAATSYSNTNLFTLTGTCNDTYQLTLYGDVIAGDVTSPAGSLTQTCAGGTFTYTIQKTGADASYNFMVKQTQNSIDSSPASKTWVRDTIAPVLSSVTGPTVKSAGAATFTYSATDANQSTVTFKCSLDSGAQVACPSPYTIASPTIGNHSLVVSAFDGAGNSVSAAAYTWTQVYKTLALYHFDGSNNNVPVTIADSSTYANNTLSNLSSLAKYSTSVKKISGSINLPATSGQGLSAANNANMDTTSTKMTIEGWFRISTLPTAGKCLPLAAKTGNGSNYSWEFRVCYSGTTYNLKFRGSTNGTSWTEITSTNLPTLATNTWYHWVTQYNQGTVTFYHGGTAYTPASNVIGVAGSTNLNVSTGALMIGSTANTLDTSTSLFKGNMDEVRISQLIRYTTNFTAPGSAFTAD